MAIAAPYNDGSGVNSGHVRLYSWDGSSWIKDSYDLDGEVDKIVFGTPVDELSGYSLSMNAAGNKLIIGAIRNDSLGIYSTDDYGHARVYSLEDLNAKSWVQIGSDINGSRIYSDFGNCVALNAAGNRVVIGAPEAVSSFGTDGCVSVYDWDGSNWTSYYNTLDNSVSSFRGRSVAINSVGNVIIYSSDYGSGYKGRLTPTCFIASLQYNYGSNFDTSIDGESNDDEFGQSVAMNANGRRFVAGAPLNDGNGTDSGSVRVHCFNIGLNQWSQIGSDIDGEFAGDQFGYSVAMNAIGNRIVAGAPYNDTNGTDSGSVRIFSWNGSTWTKLGSNINGQAAGDQNGYSVAMNESGDKVIIGAPYNDGNGSNSGRVKIYYWNGSSWIQLGRSIDGEGSGDRSGLSVSINYNGNIVAVGAPFNNGGATLSGHVRIYKLT